MIALPDAIGPLMLGAAERLLAGSVQGAVAVMVVWLVCRRIAMVPASVRAMLWWLASLKLVLALLPLPAMPLAVLPPQTTASLHITSSAVPVAAVPATDTVAVSSAAPWSSSQASDVDEPLPRVLNVPFWLIVVMGFWVAGIAAHVVHLLVALHRMRGVASRSVALGADEGVGARRIAEAVGLRRMPEIRVSDEIESPQVVGVWRPTVLLPTPVITAFTASERAMTFCHELVHVRRHDLALGWIPMLAERLFFFHPLARLASREYVIAREAACDAAVLRALDVAPDEYGRLLVRIGVTPFESGLAASAASASASSLRRRLDMLHHTNLGRTTRRAGWLLAGVVALALLPFQLVARTSREPEATLALLDEQNLRDESRLAERNTFEPEPQAPQEPAKIVPPQDAVRGSSPSASAMEQEIETILRQVNASRQDILQQRALEETRKDALIQQAEIQAELEFMRRAAEQQSVAQLREQGQRAIEEQRKLEEVLQESVKDQTLQGVLEELRKVKEATRDQQLRELETKLEALHRSDLTANQPVGRLSDQIEELTRLQQSLDQQRRVLAEMQEKLAATQRQLATESARLIEALKKLAADSAAGQKK